MKYTVVAYKTTRHEMEVDADSHEEAEEIAEGIEYTSDRWVQNYGYVDFSIAFTSVIHEND